MKLHDVPFGSLGGVDEQRIARKCPEEEEKEKEKEKDSNKSTITIKIPKHLESLIITALDNSFHTYLENTQHSF